MSISDNDKRKTYLATSLIDCFDDCCISDLEALLSLKRADPNKFIPELGLTPFHLLIGNENKSFVNEAIDLVLKYGGNPNVKNEDGLTPVHIAAMWDQQEVLFKLLNNGGDIFAVDNLNKTPIHYAIEEERIDLLIELEKWLRNHRELDKNHLDLSIQQISESLINLSSSFDSNFFENNIDSKTDSCDSQSIFSLKTEILESGIAPLESTKDVMNYYNNETKVNSCISDVFNKSFIESADKANSDLSNDNMHKSNMSDVQHVYIADDYKYVDEEEGIEFVERRYLPKPVINDSKGSQLSVDSFNVPSDYDTDTLRQELTSFGFCPGPITKTTKRVYIKKLFQLQGTTNINPIANVPIITPRVYTLELNRTLQNPDWTKNLTEHIALENAIIEYYTQNKINTKTKNRGGINRTHFTYLLLDSRVTQNLPVRSHQLGPTKTWEDFLSAVFYVGKGKRSRPYAHLYEALTVWNHQNDSTNKHSRINKKCQHILKIWKDQCGVVCLHIFQNVLSVEAHIREAAMIDAIGLKNLKNINSGNYCDLTLTWTRKQKQMLGVYLLYKALKIFLIEGERQLKPADID